MVEKESVAGATATSELRGALPPGTLLRNYEIVSILGAGGFGITYRASDITLDRFVAIKEYLPISLALRDGGTTVLPRSTELAEEFDWGRQRFIDEARTLAKLGHAPAIVRVHDFLEANGTAYMVMALAEGETLEHRLKRDQRLSWPAIQRLLDPLLAGLEEVHSTGFLHRDIKPANILLDRAGNPTLIDFGASRAAIAGRISAMTAVFTPGYAAAEQMTSARQGPWTDIYGLSATLYHAIAGKTPPNAFDRMLDDSYEPIATLAGPDFPRGILAGIDAGLALRASDRPQSIDGWRTILFMMSADSDVTHRIAPRATSVPASNPAIPPAPASGGSRRIIYAGAALAVLLLAGGYYTLAPNSPQSVQVPQEAASTSPQRPPQEIVAEKPPTEASAQPKVNETPLDSSAERQNAAAEAEKAAAEAKQREEVAARQRAEADAAAKADAEAKALADAQAEAKQKEEAEAKRATEQEAARVQAEAKAKADAEAKQRADAATAAAKDKEAAQSGEAALRLSIVDRQRLQAALTSLGFDTRGSDGTFGPRSREMIAAWQAARNQPATGFITASQQQALSREAAAALARYDEEQKKREEDKQKTIASAAPPSTALPPSNAPAPAANTPATAISPTQPFDGTYGEVRSTHQGFRQMVVRVINGRATGTFVHVRCGSGKISFSISSSGNINGEADAFDTSCRETMFAVRGQASNGQLQLNINTRGGISGGSGEVTLGRR